MSDESKSTTLGERIKEVREEKNITIEDAAAKSGLSITMWTSVEENLCNPKLKTIWIIANTLEVRPSNLWV